MLLKLFVCVVDAQLLKTVFLEGLEAEDVENSKGVNSVGVALASLVHLRRDRVVDLADDPGEELAVDGLGAGIPRRNCLLLCKASRDDLARILDNLLLKDTHHTLAVAQHEKLGCPLGVSLAILADKDFIVVVTVAVGNVSKVQNSDDDLPNLVNLLLREANLAHALHSHVALSRIVHIRNSVGVC